MGNKKVFILNIWNWYVKSSVQIKLMLINCFEMNSTINNNNYKSVSFSRNFYYVLVGSLIITTKNNKFKFFFLYQHISELIILLSSHLKITSTYSIIGIT